MSVAGLRVHGEGGGLFVGGTCGHMDSLRVRMSRFSVRLIRRVPPLVELDKDALVLDLRGELELIAYSHNFIFCSLYHFCSK